MKYQFTLVFIGFFLILTHLQSQCLLSPLTLSYQVERSEVVLEGEVIASNAFETFRGDYIYTSYTIEVSRIFKGNRGLRQIELVAPGGVVGTHIVQVNPSVKLTVGSRGTFILKSTTNEDILQNGRNNNPVFKAFSSEQSVYTYDLDSRMVKGHFEQFPYDKWYAQLETIVNEKHSLVQNWSFPENAENRSMQTITGFSPGTISAGTYSELTITGTGFGASQGSSTVTFNNADDGGSTQVVASEIHYQSWSDTEIVVWVPADAGTGPVRVVVGGSGVSSANSLNIPYTEFNFELFVDPNTWLVQTEHENNNGNGGYTFRYHTEFNSNSNAKASFERAVNSWRCASGVNWVIGATTDIDVTAEDGVNVVRFDNGAEMDEGVLGTASSYAHGCWTASYTSVHITEIDVTFNNVPAPGLTWEYGPVNPSGTEIDFESVAVHELGHAHQLGHVIDNNKVMHHNLSNGIARRVLTPQDIDGALDVHARSTGNPVTCSHPSMMDFRRVRFVDASAPTNQSGDSWSHAHKYLQDALNAPTCFDTIYLAEGLYYPDEGAGLTNNNQALSFLIDQSIVIVGGYPAGGGTRDLGTYQSILSGDIEKDGVTDGENSRTVVNITQDATLDGLIIERGYADGNTGPDRDGGGIYNSSSSIFNNIIIRYNRAVGSGSVGLGGAFYHNNGFPIFSNILAYQNEAAMHGGVFYLNTNNIECNNCTIANNPSTNQAIYVSGGAHNFRNSIFSMNDVDIEVTPGTAMDCDYSLFGNPALPDMAFGIEVIVDADPLFMDPLEGDFRLQPCSPAVNSGNNSYNSTNVDVQGNPRFYNTDIDRGAIEIQEDIPATLVTTTLDAGAGSLREIINNACPGALIQFDGGLTNSTLVLTEGLIFLEKDIEIEGLGMDALHISGSGLSRIFIVENAVNAFIRAVSLVEGQAAGGNTLLNAGNLTLESVRIMQLPGATDPKSVTNLPGATLNIIGDVIID